MKTLICTAVAGVLACATGVAFAQGGTSDGPILFTNVDVFDGVTLELRQDVNVVVTGNKITQITADDIAVAGGQVIDGDGYTLMPGLMDTHTHMSMVSIPVARLFNDHPGYAFIRSTVDAEDMLMRGVTTVRDMGGNVFALAAAIDEGLVPGPRIYPSGRFVGQTSGHYDFRARSDTHRVFSGTEPTSDRLGYSFLADGVPQVLSAVRENLRLGASQIKIAAGGGYASPTDPLLSTQYTFEEMKAAADAAADFGTYVTMHAYTPESINRAIDAGIKDVGHGQLLDKATLERMAAEGVYLSTQPFTVCNEPQLDDFSNEKLAIVCKATAEMYQMAKEIPDLKVTYGTDMFNLPDPSDQIKQMERLLPWFEPGEILKMATGNVTGLLAMSGMKNPYPDGPIGVIEEGAYADILLVDGNPLETLDAVTDTDNLKIIMKDGKIYKNTLEN
ncbi:metal-dependent hydrolase family protein [Roseibium alexandrii]|uniref:Imidazolonepropionase n=1 Tax=Roseibium alexandrii (strain DSM 17067 / NCIMB 14079 / DFL-11) TaxID=244592 RepID=A0A5E8H441_ROSAD|nr:amidohydrolase family protein [Roseibium alexandrii]EEE46714.1 Imidazolonepropionase [Roseibium alexandrii DFL-11]